jgi:hypothetical protein
LQRVVSDKITNDWKEANKEAEIEVKGWPKSAEDQEPVRVMIGEEEFEVRFFEGGDEDDGVEVRVCRIEGRFGELL